MKRRIIGDEKSENGLSYTHVRKADADAGRKSKLPIKKPNAKFLPRNSLYVTKKE